MPRCCSAPIGRLERRVVGRLAASAHKAGTREETGNGRLDLARALRLHVSTPIVPAGVRGRQAGGPFTGPYLAASSATASTPTLIGVTSGTTTAVLTLASGVPANSTIIVTAGIPSTTTGGTWSATDAAGDTYTVDANRSTAGQDRAAILRTYTSAGLASGTTISVTGAVAGTVAITAFYVRGVVQATPVDQSGTNGAGAATAAFTVSTGAAIASAPDFVAAVGQVGTVARTYGAPTCTAIGAETNGQQAFYTKVAVSGAVQTCAATLSGTSLFGAGIVAYKIVAPTAISPATATGTGATLQFTVNATVPVNSTIFVVAGEATTTTTGTWSATDSQGNTYTADAVEHEHELAPHGDPAGVHDEEADQRNRHDHDHQAGDRGRGGGRQRLLRPGHRQQTPLDGTSLSQNAGSTGWSTGNATTTQALDFMVAAGTVNSTTMTFGAPTLHGGRQQADRHDRGAGLLRPGDRRRHARMLRDALREQRLGRRDRRLQDRHDRADGGDHLPVVGRLQRRRLARDDHGHRYRRGHRVRDRHRRRTDAALDPRRHAPTSTGPGPPGDRRPEARPTSIRRRARPGSRPARRRRGATRSRTRTSPTDTTTR